MHSFGIAALISLALAQATPESTTAWKQVDEEGKTLSAEARSGDKAGLAKLLPPAREHLSSFAAKYPKDPNAPMARMFAIRLGSLMQELGLPNAVTMQQTSAEYGKVVTDASMPMAVRANAAEGEMAMLFQAAAMSKAPADWDAAERAVDTFQTTHGDLGTGGEGGGKVAYALRQLEIAAEHAAADPARYEALLTKLAKDPHPEVAALVEAARADQKKTADLKSKPMDVKFTAVDGTAVDLAKMRGKVVLIDFWATWCGPCRGETPNVVATYKKYHDKGFEIIGISLDQDKAALQKYVSDNQMTWPQYFDGKGWQNTISSQYAIQSIPAMWLVGKDGVLVTQEGRDDLDGQVSQLLGAK